MDPPPMKLNIPVGQATKYNLGIFARGAVISSPLLIPFLISYDDTNCGVGPITTGIFYQDVNYDSIQDKIIPNKHNPVLTDTLLGVRLEDKIIYLPKESFE